MDSKNNIDSVASKPCCHNCQAPLPTNELTSNTQSDDIPPPNDVNTQSPPPYSTLDTESYVNDWVLHHSRFFWTRTVKIRGKTSYQYSIQGDDTIAWTGDGRAFFTCGMMPHDSCSEDNVTTNCENVILALKTHRSQCLDCDIRYIPTNRRTCVLGSPGLLLKHYMEQHDVVCSCKCFDIHAPPRQATHMPAASGSTSQGSGTAQPRSLDPAWESEAQQGQFYCFRTIQQRDQLRFQCGINTNQEGRSYGEGPDLIFTCKMMPRAGYDKWKVIEACKNVAVALKSHRTAKGQEYSVCDFRHVQGKRIGCPATILSTSRARLLQKMRSHDAACSCRCFHVDVHGTPTIDDALGTSQLHKWTERQVLNSELEIQSNTLDQTWELKPRGRSSYNDYWTRAVKNRDDIWYQYGISERPTDNGPDIFFTCKMKPRDERNSAEIRLACKFIASAMRSHRSSEQGDYHRCACDFKTWWKRGGSGGCDMKWYDLGAKMTRSAISYTMRQHDELCSCGCFEFWTGEEPVVSGQ
jgi:hypothetical protein